ncbi:protein of unknown function [Agreia sp. COWG]|nr:protein of unknown function [Agreia sp. COWG]
MHAHEAVERYAPLRRCLYSYIGLSENTAPLALPRCLGHQGEGEGRRTADRVHASATESPRQKGSQLRQYGEALLLELRRLHRPDARLQSLPHRGGGVESGDGAHSTIFEHMFE